MFLKELAFHTKSINKVIFNKQGTLFATCANDNTIFIYNAYSYEVVNKFVIDAAVKNLVFFNKEDKIATSSALGSFYIFDVF